MFFWKFTRSGWQSASYVSLILDFHDSQISNGYLLTNFDECKDMMYLIQDVEVYNQVNNQTAGLLKPAYSSQVRILGYTPTNKYLQMRQNLNLVLGQDVLGTHSGTPLDYGKSDKISNYQIKLNLSNLRYSCNIPAKTGLRNGFAEDKLRAFRKFRGFINEGTYYDLMPAHSCIIEIVNEMLKCDQTATINFLKNDLKWI